MRVAHTEEGTGDKDNAEVEGPPVAMATALIGPGLLAHQNRPPPPPVAMASAPLFLATGQEASGHKNIAGPQWVRPLWSLIERWSFPFSI
jgi:hypothetical protein